MNGARAANVDNYYTLYYIIYDVTLVMGNQHGPFCWRPWRFRFYNFALCASDLYMCMEHPVCPLYNCRSFQSPIH